MPALISGRMTDCTAMMAALPLARASRCMFFRSDGPAATQMPARPAQAPFSSSMPGQAR